MLYVIKILSHKRVLRQRGSKEIQKKKKNTINSSATNLGYKPVGLIAENNNVCKTIRQKIQAVFYDIKSAVTCE